MTYQITRANIVLSDCSGLEKCKINVQIRTIFTRKYSGILRGAAGLDFWRIFLKFTKVRFWAQSVGKGLNYHVEKFFSENLNPSVSRARFKCPAELRHCHTRASPRGIIGHSYFAHESRCKWFSFSKFRHLASLLSLWSAVRRQRSECEQSQQCLSELCWER